MKVKGQSTIVALDVNSRLEALSLVEALSGHAGMFKVGSELFTVAGPTIVREIVDRGECLFLDLKFHDIPNTVSRAAVEAANLGVSMMTLHAAGGPQMIGQTIKQLEDSFADKRPLVVAVTVLTSIDAHALVSSGVKETLSEHVLRMGRMALEAGADGWVCSPHEISSLRSEFGVEPKIVTPGVRMPNQSSDDQQRIATPAEALAAGANHIVIGRYVNRADNPRAALDAVISSLDG